MKLLDQVRHVIKDEALFDSYRTGIYGFLKRDMIFKTVQDLLGHKDVSTTMVYTHVLNKGGMGVKGPLDMAGRSDFPPVINRQSLQHEVYVYKHRRAIQ